MANEALMVTKPLQNQDIVTSVADAVSLGEIVAKSGMFPDVTTAAQAVVKILAGRELGIPPMAALRGIHVIKGKAEIGAGLLAAMIKASGKYDYKVIVSDDQQCTLEWFQDGKQVGATRFTLDDAKRAKLIKPDGNWEKFPRAMCFARALTEGQKKFCPDVGIGAVYAPGEIAEAGKVEYSAPVGEETEPQWVSPGEIHKILEPAREKLADVKAQQRGGTLTIEKEPETFDGQNRAHNAESAARFDGVIQRLTICKVQGRDLLAAVNAECGLTRTVKTRYELTDSEVAAVCDVFEAWATKLEAKAAKKEAL